MADGTAKLSLGELIAMSSRLARKHVLALLVYIVPLTLLGTGLDTAGGSGTLLANIVIFIAGYFLYEHLLRKEGLMSESRTGRSFGAYLGVSILAGLATIVGLVLLIVPGLIFMARWSIATGIVVAEGRSVTAAMRASWVATRASQWTIVLLYVTVGLVIFVPSMVLGIGVEFFTAGGRADALGSAFVTNLFAQILSAVGFVIGVAIMQGVYTGTDELESVFA